MNISRFVVARVVLATALLAALVPASAPAQGPPDRVIVLFEEGLAATARSAAVSLGARVEADLPLVRGAALSLPPGLSPERLRGIRGVAQVEQDTLVNILKKPAPKPPASQTLPWGVDRVEADLSWPVTTGGGIKVAVVDTGIDVAHPDLSQNLKGGYNAINPAKSYTDDNGHGTHVAGTIAAVADQIGVVGVAPDAHLYAVKVLSRSGSGWTSDIIEGIQWSVDNNMDVINMSLGSSVYSAAFDTACQQAIDAGLTIVAAAGNEGPGMETVGYPAKYARVIGVSATDNSDMIASFSSRGEGVDIAAPGVSVYSTYKGQAYATLSGTSMASPHVAGVVALVLTRQVGSDDADGDGVWDPVEVQNRLSRTAHDLGTSGFDPYYGSGLVRADLAVAAQ
mgnify:CR=1 FL=1